MGVLPPSTTFAMASRQISKLGPNGRFGRCAYRFTSAICIHLQTAHILVQSAVSIFWYLGACVFCPSIGFCLETAHDLDQAVGARCFRHIFLLLLANLYQPHDRPSSACWPLDYSRWSIFTFQPKVDVQTLVGVSDFNSPKNSAFLLGCCLHQDGHLGYSFSG